MSEKNNSSTFQQIIAAGILGYGIISFMYSILGAILLVLGGIVLFPTVRNILVEKYEKLTNTKLLIFSVISVLLGISLSSAGKIAKEKKYLEENPEIAAKMNALEAEKQQKKAEDSVKYDLLAKCEVEVEKQLKKPESYNRDLSSVYYSKKAKEHTIMFNYKAQNSFGDVVPSSADCSFNNSFELVDYTSGDYMEILEGVNN